jgi:hypothetical protein
MWIWLKSSDYFLRHVLLYESLNVTQHLMLIDAH